MTIDAIRALARAAAWGWRDLCNGLGYVECLCGGDLCICFNNGETPCPGCDACEERDVYGDDDPEVDVEGRDP